MSISNDGKQGATQLKPVTLYYVHDPMCSWCYGFQPSLKTVIQNLPDNVQLVKLLGGLAADSNEPMPEHMREYVMKNWQRIETTIPSVNFNYEFWKKCRPKRSTYPACRAVIAARKQDKSYEDKMIEAIQLAYYQRARNPSEVETLIELATEIGLPGARFEEDLASETTHETLIREIHKARAMNAHSFPSLVLETEGAFGQMVIDYNNPLGMVEMIKNISLRCK